jgi:hypothetical protein
MVRPKDRQEFLSTEIRLTLWGAELGIFFEPARESGP